MSTNASARESAAVTTITDRHVLFLLRLEGAAAFVAGAAGYFTLADDWRAFVLLALAPDLAMIGYAFGPRIGGRLYNLAHTYLAPALLAGQGNRI